MAGDDDADPQVAEVFQLKVDELRKKLRTNRLSTAGKKSILQFRLVEFIQSQKAPAAIEEAEPVTDVISDVLHEENDEGMEIDDAPLAAEPIEEPAASGPNKEDGMLSDSERNAMLLSLGVDPSELRQVRPRRRTLVLENSAGLPNTPDVTQAPLEEPNETASTETATKEETKLQPRKGKKLVLTTPKNQMSIREKFAAAHSKIANKEETLEQRQQRISRRHAQLAENVPAVVQRLATPKSSRRPLAPKLTGSIFNAENANADLSNMHFKFGEHNVTDIKNVQKAPSQQKTTANVRRTVKTTKLTEAVDVRAMIREKAKAQTRKKPTVTIPLNVTTPNRSSKSGSSASRTYTPHRGIKPFVDTTLLTDREYKLAVAEGLIPGKSAQKTAVVLREKNNRQRRDEILSIKRKLKL